MTDYDSNGLDENSARFFKQMEFDKKNQFHESNRPDPSGWAEMVEEQLKDEYWSGSIGVNILCGLRPDRNSYCLAPSNIDEENFQIIRHEYPWNLDAVERRYFKIGRLVSKAIDDGDVVSIEEKIANPYAEDNLAAFGPPLPQSGVARMVKPRDLVVWAHKCIDNLPVLLLEWIDIDVDDQQPPEVQIRILKAKLKNQQLHEANLVAALALIVEDPESFIARGKSISIEQVALSLEIIATHSPDALNLDKPADCFKKRFFQNLINPVREKVNAIDKS